MLKRQIVFLLLCACCSSAVHSALTDTYSLVVTLKDGSRQTFMLNMRPSVSFEGDTFVISQPGSDVTFSCENVAGFSFANKNSSDMESVSSRELTVSYDDAENLVVYGIGKETSLKVIGMSGVLQPIKADRTADGSVSVSLKDLSAGVYVVSIGKQNFKIIRK